MKYKFLALAAMLSFGVILTSCKKDDEPVDEPGATNKGELVIDGQTYQLDGCGFDPYGEVDLGSGLYYVDLDLFKSTSGLFDDNNIYFELTTNQERAIPDGTYDYFYDENSDSVRVFTFEEAYIFVGLNASAGEYDREYDVISGTVTVTNTSNGVSTTFSGQAMVDAGPNEGETVNFSGSYSGSFEVYP